MSLFLFRAWDVNGRLVRGDQEASTEAVAVSLIQSRGLHITEIIDAAIAKPRTREKRRRRRNKIRTEEVLFFIAQAANLLHVGIPLVRSIEVIADQTDSQRLHDILQEMISNIKAGSTFKDAMARHPKIFPEFWAYLIEAGEISGTLPQILSQLAKNLEANENLKKKILSALVYPSVLVGASFSAIIVFVIFVIPIFAKLFKSFKAELPPLTAFILNLSNFMQAYFILIGAGLALIIYLARLYIETPNGRLVFHSMLLNVPIIGAPMREILHARVCIILAMLLRSGINFLRCIEVAASVSGNVIFENALNATRPDIQQGRTLAQALSRDPIFSPMLINLVKIGEESGKLPEMVDKAAEYFQTRVDIFASRVGVLIEPIIMVLVGGLIGVIVIAMFMPILKISSVVH